MKQDSRGLIAIVISVAFFLVWYTVISPKIWPPSAQPKQEQVQQEPATTKDAPAAEADKTEGQKATTQTAQKEDSSDAQANIPEEKKLFSSDLYRIELSSVGAAPVMWEILKYTKGKGDQKKPVNLVTTAGAAAPLDVQFKGADFSFPKAPHYKIVKATNTEAVFSWSSKEVEVQKIYTFDPKTYVVELAVTVKNLTDRPLKEQLELGWPAKNEPAKKSGGFLSFLKGPQDNYIPAAYVDGSVIREQSEKKLKEGVVRAGKVYWGGIESRYFLSAVVPKESTDNQRALFSEDATTEPKGDKIIFSNIELAPATIAAGDTAKHVFSVYAGPKDSELLKAVGARLDKAIDYGWFAWIAIPIRYLLKWFYSVVHNYGVAIILLTIFVKILLNPIQKKSFKSMKGMQNLQPKIKELREKFKNDKQRLNVETMQLFRSHGVNPMGGCLPMLLQFPIYIALYKVLWNSVELFQAPFFWFYKDLSAPDPYLITPILLGIFMFLQQKMTPTASADPAQQKMMMIMPVMFTAFMLFLPAGLVIYIFISTMMGVIQQYMMNHDITFRDLLKGKFRATAKA